MRPGIVLLTDTAVVLAFWSIVLPVSVSMKSRLTPDQWLYFWSQISGRWMGIMRPLLFMTAGFLIMELAGRVIRRRSLIAPMIVTLAIVLSVPGFLGWAVSESRAGILSRLEADFSRVDRAVQSEGLLQDAGIYYAVSKALDTPQDPSLGSSVK
jgi:hypothetical protein